MGWLIFIGVVLAFFYLPSAYAAVRYPPEGTSRLRELGTVTVGFFGAVFADGLTWVLGLIGILALVALWGLLR
jgi:hypothetical protein